MPARPSSAPSAGTRFRSPGARLAGRGRARTASVRALPRRAASRQEAPAKKQSKTPVAFIWGAFAVAAIVVVIIVASTAGGGDGGAAATASEAVSADTSGSYSELVERANGLYDQGIEAFNKDDAEGGVAYFEAASKVYRAAWTKQPGDPNVGTDYAVSLFYKRHHDEGIKQIDVVLKENPDFQAAHLNKGVFLKTEASEAKDKAQGGRRTSRRRSSRSRRPRASTPHRGGQERRRGAAEPLTGRIARGCA